MPGSYDIKASRLLKNDSNGTIPRGEYDLKNVYWVGGLYMSIFSFRPLIMNYNILLIELFELVMLIETQRVRRREPQLHTIFI